MNKSIEHYIPNVKNNNEILAVLSKLVSEKNTSDKFKDMKSLTNTDSINKLLTIINRNIEKSKINDDILKLFPDTEKCIQILVSSIVCPNDLITTNINYDLGELNLPVDISSNIINYVKTYIEKNYDLESKLFKIIKDTLFIKGSYCEIVIPENMLDDFINKKDIDINNAYGSNHIFNSGNATYTIGKESLDPKIVSKITNEKVEMKFSEKDLCVSIEDTPFNMIEHGRKTRKAKNLAKEHIYRIANEDLLEIEDIFKKPNDRIDKDIFAFNMFTSERESVTKPLVMVVNPDCVIPIYVKGDPSSHIGYFLLTDENYAPINNNNLNGNNSNNTGLTSNYFLVNKAKESLFGMTKSDPTYEDMELVYSNMLETMLKDRLNNSKIGEAVQLGDTEEIYRIMFNRSLRNSETKLIYLPEEMVVYYAYEYRSNGTGKSILEDLSVLFSIRAIAFFARVMATVRNSINTTTFKVDLDEKDPDPQSTVDDIVSSVLDSFQLALPIGLTNVTNLAEWAHTLGKEFSFKHPKLSNIDIDKQNASGEKVVPDSDLDEKIFEQICLRCGITADMVKSGFENDFATTVVTKNLLFAKMVNMHQLWVNKCITNHVRKLLINDPIVSSKISALFSKEIKNIKKHNKNSGGDNELYDTEINYKGIKEKELIKLLTYKVANTIYCSLPSPEITDANSLAKVFNEEMENVNNFLERILGEGTLPEVLGGKGSEHLEMLKNMLIGLHSIDWASKNGLYKDILGYVLDNPNEDDNKNKLAQTYGDIRKKIVNNIYLLLKNSVVYKNKFGDKFEKLEEELQPETDDEDYMDDDDESGESMDEEEESSEDETLEDDTENTEEELDDDNESESSNDNDEEEIEDDTQNEIDTEEDEDDDELDK